MAECRDCAFARKKLSNVEREQRAKDIAARRLLLAKAKIKWLPIDERLIRYANWKANMKYKNSEIAHLTEDIAQSWCIDRAHNELATWRNAYYRVFREYFGEKESYKRGFRNKVISSIQTDDGIEPILDHIAAEDSFEKLENHITIDQLLKPYTPRERAIALMYFRHGLGLEEIAKKFNLSTNMIWRIVDKITESLTNGQQTKSGAVTENPGKSEA